MTAILRIGQGFDIHRFAPNRPLVLGGETFEHPLGLAGHSDADVLCHAVADALLGAVAAGDIGDHFPDTDPAWANASSLDLLARAAAVIRARGGRLVNVDATVLAEAPRLAPRRDRMRANLARVLNLPLDAVSIKATTLERLGALGAGEGIAALAVAGVALDPASGAPP
jgi:2-C-methyl-D-erythritol 2,4-cyclodiphosphate synthase